MDYKQYRFFARDEFGRDLFFIEMDNSDGLELMFFSSSLGIDLENHPALSERIRELRKSNNTAEKRNELAEKVISGILLIPTIEQYFFPDYLLSASGSYLEFADRVVADIVQHSDFSDFTPFSEDHHPLVFRKLRLLLNDWHRQGRGENVDESAFLALLPKNEELQHLFVAYHSEGMEYLKFHFVDDDHDCWALYALFCCSTLAFAFSMHIA
jgi:hypothetical protein